MEQYLDTASTVTKALFGPESGIPWWAWIAVIVAVFWKVAVKEPKSAREAANERDNVMLGALFSDDKKGKKKK
ncbi:hypothetical protein Aab01nite_67720 [Paractinoplanes abujensis]|uniref:Uncharacterized protein n=1 Tax=Paractinoplanes abujensis TaxID=882441 RepID=A0A7W7CYF4_9ACTN|nr:hypothetical protein [Actinoplanes abujensis]MBB4695598.1 hypothetical protein [Actinoplanes abujensis]GID23182.1 hypothetical protein Aab01nite_67720 [Actinoplanes abujensis]